MNQRQRDLEAKVRQDGTGRDLRDVLRATPADQADKRAVADALGGPGSGARDFPDR